MTKQPQHFLKLLLLLLLLLYLVIRTVLPKSHHKIQQGEKYFESYLYKYAWQQQNSPFFSFWSVRSNFPAFAAYLLLADNKIIPQPESLNEWRGECSI